MDLNGILPTRPSSSFTSSFLLQARARVHLRNGFSSLFANGVYSLCLQKLREFNSSNHTLLNMQVNAFYSLIKPALDPVQLRHSSDSRIQGCFDDGKLIDQQGARHHFGVIDFQYHIDHC